MAGMFRFSVFIFTAFSCVLGLSSCHFFAKNFSFVSDSVRGPQEDQVAVEKGSSAGLTAVGSAVSTAPVSTAVDSVQVQRGDTLSAIARRHGVKLSALCGANGLTPSSVIRTGQRLKLPSAGQRVTVSSPVKPASATHSYKVQPGETLGGIAARHRTTVIAIMRANNMTADQANRIRAGQVLRIPSVAR